MVFEKKWTEEQNKELLELHGRISNKEIAEKFNISPTNVSKRVSHLRKLEKRIMKKKSKAEKKYQSNKEIEVMTAPSHNNADELMKEYKVDPINKEKAEEKAEDKTSQKESHEDSKLNWDGVANTITIILDKRFITNDLAPLTDEEKQLFANALNEALRLRAQFYFQYADIFNLALASFAIMSPRILEFLDRKKRTNQEAQTAATIDLSTTNKPKEDLYVDELV